MVLWQMTGDRSWLEEPFKPGRDVNLIADEAAGLPSEVRSRILSAAADILSNPSDAAIPVPTEHEMVEAMSACLGERVPPEYAPMMGEEMGFVSRHVTWKHGPVRPSRPIVVVGAGASGIAAAANLETLGLPYVVLEQNDEVGGTWLVNRYPGCAVDTPNHAYSFSHGPVHDWPRYFSRRNDLLAYMIDRSHVFGIRDKILFRTRVTGANWDATASCWRIRTEGQDGPQELEAMAFVPAIGPIAEPKLPIIPGLETFRGSVVHSSQWPQQTDLSGKRVAVIGTGASAMQIVPTIVEEVAHLTVFQRTPQWVRHIPRFKDEMSAGARWLLRHLPLYAAWFRFTMLWRYGDGLLKTLKRDPEWPHPERAMNRINDRHRVQMTNFIQEELVGRPDLIAKCLPAYPPYAKRILLDNGWYRALRNPGTTLVTDRIEAFSDTGIIAGGTEYEADLVVCATGFNVFQNAARLDIRGSEGRRLADEWAEDDPKAYLGITVPGFPNMFVLQGPNTVLAHGGSAIFTSECQARYAVSAIVGMLEQKISAIDVRRPVHDAYMDAVDAEHRELVWAHPGMVPWYRNRKGRVAAALPWRLVDYRQMTLTPDFTEYHLTPA